MTMALIAIVSVVLFGGQTNAYAEISVSQDNSPEVQAFLDMVGELRTSGVYISYTEGQELVYLTQPIIENRDNISFITDENGNNHFTIELTESLSISDSVEVGSP